jgi:hypothetical protein
MREERHRLPGFTPTSAYMQPALNLANSMVQMVLGRTRLVGASWAAVQNVATQNLLFRPSEGLLRQQQADQAGVTWIRNAF